MANCNVDENFSVQPAHFTNKLNAFLWNNVDKKFEASNVSLRNYKETVDQIRAEIEAPFKRSFTKSEHSFSCITIA